MHGAVGNPYVHESTIVLLIVQGVVLQTHRRSVVLCALGVGHRQQTAEYRVFTQIFIGTSARGDALDIDGRTQYHVLATQAGLMTHAPSVGVGPFRAPRGSQCRTRREEGGGVGGQVEGVPGVGLHLLTDTEGAVGIFHISDVQTGDASRREHVLAVQHVDLFLEGHALDDMVNRDLVFKQLGGILLRLGRERPYGQCRNSQQLESHLCHNVVLVYYRLQR